MAFLSREVQNLLAGVGFEMRKGGAGINYHCYDPVFFFRLSACVCVRKTERKYMDNQHPPF